MLSLLFLLLGAADAKRIEVDWKIPMREQAALTAAPGDVINFAWRGFHNVFVLPECDGMGIHAAESFTCPSGNESWGVELGESTPVEYTVPNRPGEFVCFVCEVGRGGHCRAGQHTTLLIEGGDAPQPEPISEIGIDWIIPGGESMELQKLSAAPGTTLIFSWGGFHNVWLMKTCSGKWKPDEFSCDFTGGRNLGQASPVSFTIPENAAPGSFLCFACEVGSHCKFGQHTTVEITGGASPNPDPTASPTAEPQGGDDAPFETLDELLGFCKNADEDDCKLCGAKFKRGKCAVKSKKLQKMKCKKVKDADFCAKLSCNFNKKRNKCAGKTFLQQN